ncbi:MAG: hypothetical protein ACODAJ_14775 [Planctomycetota bacterium]
MLRALEKRAAEEQQRLRWQRWWLRLAGLSFLLAAAMLYEPWLESYGYPGATPLSDSYQRRVERARGARYPLLLCAAPGLLAALVVYQVKAWDEVGPRSVSAELYVYSRQWLSRVFGRPDNSFLWMTLRFWRSLLFPRGDDPVITRCGKLCWLVLLVAFPLRGVFWATGTLLGMYPLPDAPMHTVSPAAEQAFVEHVWRMYTVTAAIALVVALAWPYLRWPWRRRGDTAGAEQTQGDRGSG